MEKHTWSEFFKVFKEIIDSGRIVIDDFHRLPVEFLDYLHSTGIRGAYFNYLYAMVYKKTTR